MTGRPRLYTLEPPLGCSLSRDDLFCSFSVEVLVANWAAYISPTAGGTCQKYLTKHHDWADAPECKNSFYHFTCIGEMS